MKNKHNTIYYFVTNDEGETIGYISKNSLPDWFLNLQESNNNLENYKDNENGICDKDHPLPCGLDRACSIKEL